MKYMISIILFFSLFSFQDKETLKWDYNKKDWTPLMKAIYKQDTKTVIKLIKKNINIDLAVPIHISDFKITALEVAIRKKNTLAVELLLKTKKYIDLDEYLIVASSEDNVNILKLLFEYNANPNYIEKNGNTLVMFATGQGSDEVLIELLKSTVNINKQRKVDGMTALMLASYSKNLEKVKILLNNGADKEIKDNRGKTAFDYVNLNNIKNPQSEIIEQLKELLKLNE
jgi:uncharacterized protein